MTSTPQTLPSTTRRSLRRRLRSLLRSDRGSVTVEFVIIVPLMLLAMLGFSEIYMYMRAVSLIEHTAFTLADSIGQMSSVINETTTGDSNSLGSIWSAATLIAAPNTLQAKGGVIITSICDQTIGCDPTNPPNPPSMAAGAPQQYWQQSAPWNLSGVKSKETGSSLLPATWPFRNGDSAVVVEVFYSYTPFSMTMPFWTNAPGTQTIYERVYVRPRTGRPLPLVAAS